MRLAGRFALQTARSAAIHAESFQGRERRRYDGRVGLGAYPYQRRTARGRGRLPQKGAFCETNPSSLDRRCVWMSLWNWWLELSKIGFSVGFVPPNGFGRAFALP
jgi:hypothetical protein